MAELSILIPSRKEEWLARTIQDILEHREAQTEVIAVLDGEWPDPPIPQHPDVHLLYLPQAIGQRAATNLAAKLSEAEFLMKCDAHVAFEQGFDKTLIAAARELGPDVVQIPAQKNLHIWDWVCACGKRDYQGPKHPCVSCGGEMTREMVWKPRRGVHTTSWRLDATLHFQYWGEDQKRQQGDLCDVMTSLGACMFLSRDYYHRLGGFDEGHGSWGQLGAELALKAWLSGGRHVVNKRTWFSHFFRTGGIGFPYPIHGSDQEKARVYSRNLWRENAWPGQTQPLRWLIDKFWPVPGWSDAEREALSARIEPAPCDTPVLARHGDLVVKPAPMPTRAIVYYSDCLPDPTILSAVRRRLETMGLPIIAVTLQPIEWPAALNVVVPLARGAETMFRQMLIGLEVAKYDVVFLCEHDVLYHPSHFEMTPTRPDVFSYNQHVYKVSATDGRAVHYRCSQTSGLCATRDLLLTHYRKRLALVETVGYSRNMGFEPGTHGRTERVDDFKSETWMSAAPNIDIRHDVNLTPSRWNVKQFRNPRYCQGWTEVDSIPGWGLVKGRFWDFLAEHTSDAAQQQIA